MIRVNNLGKESFTDLAEISAGLDKLEPRYSIDIINWKEFSYKPEVKFILAYSDSELYIKYYVRESFVKAEKVQDNSKVCEDSCVEFFVAPTDDGIYYNFEFNSIGTCYLGSGHGRDDSKPVNNDLVGKVRRLSSMENLPFSERQGEQEWELTVAIPLDVIFGEKIQGIKGRKIKANFYKCGDMLSKPHYLTWNKIATANPDYHRPEYFGEIIFD